MKWDNRFLALADLVADWSKDPSTKCGAVIVRPDLTVASVGYNGFPRGCDDSEHLYAARDEKYQRTIHAEVNAILAATEPVRGYTLYTVPGPSCDRCAACIIQAGISRVVHRRGEFAEGRWSGQLERGLQMYNEARVRVDAL